MNAQELLEQFEAGLITWDEMRAALDLFGLEVSDDMELADNTDLNVYYLVPLNEETKH